MDWKVTDSAWSEEFCCALHLTASLDFVSNLESVGVLRRTGE